MHEAFLETGVLDEPCGRQLDVVACREAGNLSSVREGLGALQERLEGTAADDGVHEEGAIAPRVGIVSVQHHALSFPDGNDRIAHAHQVGGGDAVLVEQRLKLRIADAGFAARSKPERHGGDQEAAFRLVLEDARTIAEPAFIASQGDDATTLQLQRLHADDRLADILSVRADVLDRRGAGGAGDAGQALDAGPCPRHSHGNDAGPRLSSGDSNGGAGAIDTLHHDPAQGHMENQSGEPFVRYQKVASATEDEKRMSAPARPCHRPAELIDRGRAEEETRRPADPESGQRSQQHVALQAIGSIEP